MKNLLTRALTGALYVAVIVCGILLGPVAFTALCCLLAGLAIYEFHHVTALRVSESNTTLILDICGGLVMVMGACFCFASPGASTLMPRVWGSLFLLFLLTRLVAQLYDRRSSPLASLTISLASLVYIALPIALMSVIYGAGSGKWLVLSMFVMIWLNDTGAYLVGCSIGRRRLFERISPKKSWEGFFGGLVFAVAGGPAMGWLCGLDPLRLAVMGLITGVFATWGDLVESLIKRTLDIKDSGHLLPGHGGILDRIDSLLLVSPAVTLYLLVLTLF